MSNLRNKVNLIGTLGSSPQISITESGKKCAKFSIATNEIYRNSKGEKVKETQWHNIVAWNKIADVVEKYLNRGIEVALEGQLLNKNYVDKEGNKKYITEVQLTEILILGNIKK